MKQKISIGIFTILVFGVIIYLVKVNSSKKLKQQKEKKEDMNVDTKIPCNIGTAVIERMGKRSEIGRDIINESYIDIEKNKRNIKKNKEDIKDLLKEIYN